jgi:hypothetical protein
MTATFIYEETPIYPAAAFKFMRWNSKKALPACAAAVSDQRSGMLRTREQGKRFAFRAHLRELKLPFNDRLGPSENVDRGLPCPRLLPQYFEPVPGYALGICEDRVFASHHPCVIAVQFHLGNLLGKFGGTGIKELLIVLLNFCFPVHHLESGQKLDKSRIFRELCRDPAGIFLVVQFAALGDDRRRRRRKVLRTILLRGAWQSRSDCYRNEGKQELPC